MGEDSGTPRTMAVSDWKTIFLPGYGVVSVPVNGTKKHHDHSGMSKSTPEWMISFDGLLVGHIPEGHNGDDKATELFGFTHNTLRETVEHSVNQLIANAATRWSDLIVIIQNATYSPILEQCMNHGTLIDQTVITRWGWIGGVFTQLEERVFRFCYITQFRQILDYVALFIRYEGIAEKLMVYNQKGASVGQVGSDMSARTGLTTMT